MVSAAFAVNFAENVTHRKSHSNPTLKPNAKPRAHVFFLANPSRRVGEEAHIPETIGACSKGIVLECQGPLSFSLGSGFEGFGLSALYGAQGYPCVEGVGSTAGAHALEVASYRAYLHPK